MKEAVKDLLESVEFSNDETPYFKNKNYTSFNISNDYFHNIKSFDSDKKICFIDGGNQEIIGSHNFSLQLIRVYYNVYENNKKVSFDIFESLVLINVKKRNNELCFVTKIFPIKNKKNEKLSLDNFSFDIYDGTLKKGNDEVSVSSIGDAMRRFYEISLAKFICDKKLCDVIILDGSLEVKITSEKEVMQSLYDSSKLNNVSIFSLSKTSSIFTNSGKSLLAVLNSIGPRIESWYYYPIVKIKSETHKSEIYIVKLHEKSNYVFKFEKYIESEMNIEEILSLLKKNSNDAVFLGYPYGLIDADRFARVSNNEIEIWKMKLLSTLGKDFEKIRYTLNSKNAHSILDNIG